MGNSKSTMLAVNATNEAMRRERVDLVRDAARVFFAPGDVVELRIPKAGRYRTVSGYFDDWGALADAAVRWSGKAGGVYWMSNPVTPALLARSANRERPYAESTTADHDIAGRRWLYMDFDPVRPAGIASTDAEHAAALLRADSCAEALHARGWPAPVRMDSGNGAALLFRIDEPNDEVTRRLIERVLQALDLAARPALGPR